MVAVLVLVGCGSDEPSPGEDQASRDQVAQALGYEDEADMLAAQEAEADREAQERWAGSLNAEVGALWHETYGDLGGWPAVRFTEDNGATNVTVEADLAYKDENREPAMGLCRSVASLGPQVEQEWRRVIVTAGHRGGFLAECDPVH